jgi:hypothetical protein
MGVRVGRGGDAVVSQQPRPEVHVLAAGAAERPEGPVHRDRRPARRALPARGRGVRAHPFFPFFAPPDASPDGLAFEDDASEEGDEADPAGRDFEDDDPSLAVPAPFDSPALDSPDVDSPDLDPPDFSVSFEDSFDASLDGGGDERL